MISLYRSVCHTWNLELKGATPRVDKGSVDNVYYKVCIIKEGGQRFCCIATRRNRRDIRISPRQTR